MWVIIYDPFPSNLGIDENWNRLDYPRIFIIPLLFFLYVESLLCKPKFSLFSYTDCLHWRQTWYCECSRLGPLNGKFCSQYCLIDCLLCCRILKQWNMVKLGHPSDWYTSFGDSYLSTISNKLSLNPCKINCRHWPRPELYSRFKFCRVLHHSDNVVPHGHHSYARTRGIMNYLQWTHIQEWLWSTHFSVFHRFGPESKIVI